MPVGSAEQEFSFFRNAAAATREAYEFGGLLSLQAGRRALAEVGRCPRYAPSPLRSLPEIARSCGVAEVSYKDESGRFGLASFKALGGAYAVGFLLAQHVGRQLHTPVTIEEIASGRHREATGAITVACATDGNHGRSVAAGARHFGCACVIFLHEGVSGRREAAIASLGARVVRTAGDYDDSVREAQRTAHQRGWLLVSDTSSAEGERVAAVVMQGYSVMCFELIAQLEALGGALPTHVFLQGGVGGLAASLIAHFWEEVGAARLPRFVIVEPEAADCLLQSAKAGRPSSASGDLDTVMAGLSCGEPSFLAWPIIQAGAEFFMTVPDEAAIELMRRLAGFGIVAGESATAGLAALERAAASAPHRASLDLTPTSRVLVIGTEGATDPVLYQELVGLTPGEVLARTQAK